MSAKTGQVVTPLFTTANPVIGSAQNADSLPTGTLYLNGTANGAAVTVTNLAAGLYKAAVTMPALAAGDRVSLSIAATVGGVTGKGIIWGDFGETATASDVNARLGTPAGASVVEDIATRAATGAAMTLTTGERTSIATSVWAATTRTLSGFGTLVADVWASATRALTDKAGFSGTATNMVAAAPLAAANAAAVRTELGTELGRVDAAISSRLATTGYTAAPSIAALATESNATTNKAAVIAAIPAAAPLAGDNASAVRTNLDTELARIDENVSAAKTLTSGERTSIAGAVSGLATTGLAAIKALLDAVKLKSDTIGALAVTVTSPVAASGTITVYSGDDYASADSRAITVAVADLTHALGLDGAVVKLKATQATWEAASVASTTDGYAVTFEATAAQTAAVTRAQHYELEATLANGHVVTLAKGSLVTRTNIPAVV